MKKFKKISLLCATLGIVFATATTAFADDGKEIKKFYNFNDYTAEVGSDIMPDENWDYLVGRYNQFGSAYADEEHQRVLKANNISEPNFYFGQSINTGNLHISFDAKALSPSQRFMSIWYHQRNWGTATLPRRTETSSSGYSMLLRINAEQNVFSWYQKPGKNTTSMLGWDTMESDKSFDFTQWHRFDIITNGLSGDDCYADVYLDGEKMNETPIYFGASEGFHTFGLRLEPGTGSNPMGAYFDNVRVHRFSGEESLEMNITSDERVGLNDGKLKIHLSDFVDTGMLTKDNIDIRQKGGGSISNFSITPDANGGGFDVNFSGAIEPGRYEIRLSNNVRGKLTGAVSGDALAFKTDFKTVNVDGSIYDNDFNDYTSTDGTPPSGFSVSGEKSYAKSVEGKNGGDDRAFGLKSDENGRTVQRYMTKFNADIRPDSDGNISFDFTVPTADTGEVRFYLSTPNDPEKNAPNALFKVDSTGSVYIADSETANPSKKLDGIRLAANEWHNVNAKIRTDGKNGESIELIFDNSSEYKVSYTAPYFTDKTVDGTGMGFVPREGFAAAVDNISVRTNMSVACPEVISIKLFDNLGRELKTEGKITAMTSYAEIKFNTVVTDDTQELKNHIILNENTWTKDYDCSVVTSEDGRSSTVVCGFPQMLEEMSNYKLVVNAGIPSRLSDSVKSVLADELNFITDRTKALSISGFDPDGNATSELTFTKNDSSAADLLYGAAQYEYKKCMVDGVETDVPIMKDFKFKRIVIDKDFIGSITESVDLPITGGNGETGEETSPKVENKYYLWKYPSMHKVLLDSENVLQ